MYALLLDNRVIEMDSETFPADGEGFSWIDLMAHHGEVTVGMTYNSVSDSFLDIMGETLYQKIPVNGIYTDIVVETIMTEIPHGYTLLPRGDYEVWNEALLEWQQDPTLYHQALIDAREAKKNEIRDIAKSEIESSFTSNALGATHTYDSRKEDQNNLLIALTEAELSTPTQQALVKCNDNQGFIDRLHSLVQIKEVIVACGAHIRPIRDKLEQKKGEVDSMITIETVQNVSW